jgi:hypothetical protein
MKNKEEIWKDIPGYEGYYKVSNLGNVKSVDRYIKHSRSNGFYKKKGKLLSQRIRKGYYYVDFSIKSKVKRFDTHQLVAMAFLGHKPKGHNVIIDHKEEGNKLDNRLENLQITTQRGNLTKAIDKNKTSSKYIGVSYVKNIKKWRARICIDGKSKHLGNFQSEYEAHLAYQAKLTQVIKK